MINSALSSNGLMISMLIEGFPVAVVESFGDSPISWTDREVVERILTPDNLPKNIVKNASYICTLSLTHDSIICKSLQRVCGDNIGRKGMSYKKPPKIQMTVTNLAADTIIPEVYTQGTVTSVPAGSSADSTRFQDYNFIIAFHEKKV